MKQLVIFSIEFYCNNISNRLLHSCRFYPTCSGYAIEAITTHGVLKGTLRSIRRILRCHPFGGVGIDLVK